MSTRRKIDWVFFVIGILWFISALMNGQSIIGPMILAVVFALFRMTRFHVNDAEILPYYEDEEKS